MPAYHLAVLTQLHVEDNITHQQCKVHVLLLQSQLERVPCLLLLQEVVVVTQHVIHNTVAHDVHGHALAEVVGHEVAVLAGFVGHVVTPLVGRIHQRLALYLSVQAFQLVAPRAQACLCVVVLLLADAAYHVVAVGGHDEEAGIKEGDHIQVKLLEIDPKTGKYKLSHRVLIEKPEGYQERPARRERPERGERRPRPERGERRDRGPRPERGDRGERRPRPEQANEEYRDPAENREPKDFSDALDHMDF